MSEFQETARLNVQSALRAWRTYHPLDRIAQRLGVAPSTVHRWAAGQCFPRAQQLEQLARELELPRDFDTVLYPKDAPLIHDARVTEIQRLVGLQKPEELLALYPALLRLLARPGSR